MAVCYLEVLYSYCTFTGLSFCSHCSGQGLKARERSGGDDSIPVQCRSGRGGMLHGRVPHLRGQPRVSGGGGRMRRQGARGRGEGGAGLC